MAMATNSSLQPVTYRAHWVVPVEQPPIENGVVTIAGGSIVRVGRAEAGQAAVDLGDVALLPGLVNAHTHLEFSLLTQPLGHAGMGFASWIRAVVEHRREEGKRLLVETDGFQRFRRRAAQAGIAELIASGTVAVGDVATVGWPRESFPVAGLRTTVFMELLGLDPAGEDSLLAMGQSFVQDLFDKPGKMQPGLSPHAPYTVSQKMVERACQLSRQERFPVAMHLAESRDELELLAGQRGPMVEVLQALGAWHPDNVKQNSKPLDYLRLLATAKRALVIHGNYLAEDEIDFLAAQRERMSVVYCPRTHAYFGHDAYPLDTLLQAGARVALGTDSRASSPDLNLWEELRHVARHHSGISRDSVLKMGTLWAAEALGIADRYGSIAPGKSDRLAVVPLTAGSASSSTTYETLFTSAGSAYPLARFAADTLAARRR